MFRFKHRTRRDKGFTIVELMVVAPVVILTIGAFVTVIVGMTGDVLASRSSSNLLFNIQDALNRVEQDIKLSSAFLATNSITPLQTGQGYNDITQAFENVSTSSTGTELILNSIATTGNPIVSGSAYVYAQNAPNACTSTLITQNTPQSMNIVYFVKYDGSGVGTLWRRTIMQSNYTDTTTSWCNAAWQEPSCTPGFTASFCKAQDVQLVTGLSTSGFSVQYYNAANSTSQNATASDTSQTDQARNTALQSATTATVTITASQTVAGRTSSQTSTMRATRLDINASSIVSPVTPTTPAAPVPTGVLSGSDSTSATFSWERVSGAVSYNLDYNINGGTWTSGLSSSSATTFTVQGTRNQPVNVRVSANGPTGTGTSGYGNATVTIPLFTPMTLLNGWSDYNQGYSSSAYTKTSSGLVVLKGLIKGGTATADTNIAILPVGYRPANTLMFAVTTNNTTGRLDVRPDGTVRFEVGSNAFFNLDGVNFMPSGTTFTALTPINSWVNYNNGTYSNPIGYTQASDGRVSLEGLVSSGTTTTGTAIAALPASIAPPGYEHIAVLAGNAFGIMALASAGAPVPNAVVVNSFGTNAFDSTQAMFYPYTYAGATALTLQNSWTWYGSFYSSPRYTKSADGMVVVNGLIKSGTTTLGTVIATLPVGYRPSAEEIFLTPSNGAWGRVDVLANGNIVTNSVSNAWVSLDTISFMPEQ